MTLCSNDIYKSENGDNWRLIHDPASGRVFVRHEANLSSGGHITDMDVEEFSSRAEAGPVRSGVCGVALSSQGTDTGQMKSGPLFLGQPAPVRAHGATIVRHRFSCGTERREVKPAGESQRL